MTTTLLPDVSGLACARAIRDHPTLPVSHATLIGALCFTSAGTAEISARAAADVFRYPRVESLLARTARFVREPRSRRVISMLPRTTVVLRLRDSLKMRGFQAAAVQAGSATDALRVPVMTEVIDVLTGFKRTDGQHENQPVTQPDVVIVSDPAVPSLNGDGTLPDQTIICCTYATCMDTL